MNTNRLVRNDFLLAFYTDLKARSNHCQLLNSTGHINNRKENKNSSVMKYPMRRLRYATRLKAKTTEIWGIDPFRLQWELSLCDTSEWGQTTGRTVRMDASWRKGFRWSAHVCVHFNRVCSSWSMYMLTTWAEIAEGSSDQFSLTAACVCFLSFRPHIFITVVLFVQNKKKLEKLGTFSLHE